MNVYELFESDIIRTVLATPKFITNFRIFEHKYPILNEKLNEFITFRRTARPDQPFNRKDSPMTGALKGLRRCHLIFGRALVLYTISRDNIFLIDIVEHDEIEGRSTIALRNYVDNLTQNNFRKFEITVPQITKTKIEPLTNKQKEHLITLFKMIAQNPSDKYILINVSRGDLDDFLLWARYALNFENESHDRAIIQALGGKQMVMKWATLWMMNK